jgi:hypothetical protein
METTIPTKTKLTTDADYAAAVGRRIAEMERMREEMAQDQREIESLRAQTRAILNRMKAH